MNEPCGDPHQAAQLAQPCLKGHGWQQSVNSVDITACVDEATQLIAHQNEASSDSPSKQLQWAEVYDEQDSNASQLQPVWTQDIDQPRL